ncbi:MAG: RT0821/Lpp0805 family surface protein [Hyphomicrobiales bacterium]|nr:RT0821/Lpp0805 family surface protein [Hyphomicrobiales bacterium]
MKILTLVALSALIAFLPACGPGVTNQDRGTVIGAVGGGLIGNQFGKGGGRVAATGAGVIIGGIIGNQIGRDLDEEERRRAMDAEYHALEYGRDYEPRRWNSSRAGRYGVIKPGRRYSYESMTCREFEHEVYIDGEPEVMRGRACRQRDGTWKQI